MSPVQPAVADSPAVSLGNFNPLSIHHALKSRRQLQFSSTLESRTHSMDFIPVRQQLTTGAFCLAVTLQIKPKARKSPTS